jgi:chromosome partitioning protein
MPDAETLALTRTKAPRGSGKRPGEQTPQTQGIPQREIAERMTRWVLCASGKGGSGKSTLSRNLAVYAAHSGLRVATVDFDKQGTLTNWYQRRPDEAPQIQHFSVPMAQAQEGLVEVAAIKNFDLIIMDTPPGIEDHAQSTRLLIKRANLVLVPTGQGGPDIDSVIEWMTFLKREGAAAAFVLNRTKRSAGSLEKAKLRLVEIGRLCPIDVRDLEDIQVTYDSGLGIAEVRGGSGTTDLLGVWRFVCSELGIEG